jgi:hypothetical protein
MSEIAVTFFGPLDTIVGPYIEEILLVLVVSNMLTRKLANDSYREQVENGADADDLDRHPLHVFSMWGLVLASLYYLTLHHHGGIVMSALALGLFLTDFFEFESRRVEVSEDRPLERPKAALVASVFVLLYAGYQSVFFLVEPLWNAVV